MRKIITILLAMLFLLAFTGTTLAADSSESELSSTPPSTRYVYMTSVEANLNIVSSTAYMSAEINCSAIVDSCSISAYLQRYENGAWVNVQHYSKYSSTNYCSWSSSHSATAGYSYRLRVYFYAWSGDNRESTVVNAY